LQRRLATAPRVLAALAVLAAATGCAPGLRRVSTPDGAFIYGFFAVPEKVGDANCVGIIQDERAGIGYRHGCMNTSPEGLFFAEDVPPMRYNIHGFYVDNTHNALGDTAKLFTVRPGELHLYGIYRYQVVSKPFLVGQGKFSLTPGGPSHAEVLRKLLQQESISAKWKKRIQARLKELGG
jgi:hypothetical protein